MHDAMPISDCFYHDLPLITLEDEALEIYVLLIEIPSDINIRFFMLDPQLDELRDHPRYKSLVKKYKPEEWADLML